MDRRELVLKMLEAFYLPKFSIGAATSPINVEHMDQALSVAIDELLKPVFELTSFEYFANQTLANRRAKLERVKTPEERVTIQSHTTCTAVMLDGKIDCMLNGPREAEIYRLGLIQQLKDGTK